MAMAAMKSKPSSTSTLLDEIVLHEGWCVKESGSAFLGKTNWRKRWFRLVQRGRTVLLQYHRNKTDKNPAGFVKLDVTYCTRPLENHEKPQKNCFAVGALVDDGTIRTYYISCSNQLAMQEWMTVIDAAIQGVPEEVGRRRKTVHQRYKNKEMLGSDSSRLSSSSLSVSRENRGLDLSTSMSLTAIPSDHLEEVPLGASVDVEVDREDLSDDEVCDLIDDESYEREEVDGRGGATSELLFCNEVVTIDSHLSNDERLAYYSNPAWRMERWKDLCSVLKTAVWSKVDNKDGITVARSKFGRGHRNPAVIKVEGTLEADPSVVYQFMQITTREGGKLDYLFRNETLIDIFEDEPTGSVIHNHFQLPIPRISCRDITAMKLWVPGYLTPDAKCGLVMFSVDHPYASPPGKDVRRIGVDASGLVLAPYPGPGGAVHTRATIIVQLATFGALHRMLKGAYNSGLLKVGLRSTFTHMSEQLQRFVEITNI